MMVMLSVNTEEVKALVPYAEHAIVDGLLSEDEAIELLADCVIENLSVTEV